MSDAPDSLELEIDCLSVKKMLDDGEDFALLDVRTEFERQLAVIADTPLITQELADEMMASWPKDKEIVLYCHSGIRSLQAAQYFREQGGFVRCRSMAGGIAAWSAVVDPSVPTY